MNKFASNNKIGPGSVKLVFCVYWYQLMSKMGDQEHFHSSAIDDAWIGGIETAVKASLKDVSIEQ